MQSKLLCGKSGILRFLFILDCFAPRPATAWWQRILPTLDPFVCAMSLTVCKESLRSSPFAECRVRPLELEFCAAWLDCAVAL